MEMTVLETFRLLGLDLLALLLLGLAVGDYVKHVFDRDARPRH